MEYPTLRRPKRKLCYVTNNERPHEQWAKPLSLEDVDKMFDDMDPTPTDDIGPLPDSPLHETFDVELNQKSKEASAVKKGKRPTERPQKCVTNHGGHLLQTVTASHSPVLDIDSDLAFKAHGPMKTSSPVEKDVIVDGVKQLDNEDNVVSPILFACEDEGEEEANHKPSPTQKPQCNGPTVTITEPNDDSGLESPLCTVTLSKPKMSSHPNKEDKSGREITELPVSAERQEFEAATPAKKAGTVHHQPKVEASTRKDAKSFLEKLRDAAQPEPVYSRKSLSPVAVRAAPVPEDDFLILEDDTPIWWSIPSKTVGSRQQKTSKTSSSDKDSSTDKEGKDNPLETVQKQPEAEQPDGKAGSQTVDLKMKKKNKKEVTESANGPDEMSPEHLSIGDFMKQKEQANRKKQLQKHHESTKAEIQAEDRTSAETKDKTPNLKITTKPQKATDTKRTKSLKARNENTKKSKTKPLNRTTEATMGSDGDQDLVIEQRQEQTRMEPAVTEDSEDFDSSTEKEINDTEAQSAQMEIQTEVTGPSEEASAEDSLVLGKRKRKPTGQWWLSCPVDTESAKVTDKQPKPKKSKKNDKEPTAAAAPSPTKTKKQKVVKTSPEMQPSPSSRKIAKSSKEKKTKPAKSKKTKKDAAERLKASLFEEEEQQEALDQDLDSQPSSPLDLSHRDHNVPSGSRIFQKVYHPVSNGKLSAIPTPASPRAPREQLISATKTDKRKRKPPGSWWMNHGECADVNDAVSSSQPQQQEAKPRKERRKQAKPSRSPGLGAPKNGNVSVSPVTAGGARPLKVKPVMAPKSLRRTLATFKDIFTSATETPPAVSSREDNTCKVSACPPVEVTVTDFTSPRRTADPPSVDVYDYNHESQENSLKALRSGPSSMIDLAEYDDDNQNLPSSIVAAVLSVSDLCGPPLKPLILQPKDKANLKEWFKSLWSTSIDDAPEITPEQFDWYFHQGRAIGFQVDQNCGTICSGKILLGSYMKKPLWVDHSATTVFNLLTSSVTVTINGSESRYHPGQAFMVPCGHAYSIQNTTSQPAVLYFTRVLAESSD